MNVDEIDFRPFAMTHDVLLIVCCIWAAANWEWFIGGWGWFFFLFLSPRAWKLQGVDDE